MALYTSGHPKAFLPDEVADLVVRPVQRDSIAFTVGTTVEMNDRTHEYRVPLLTGDPSAAWTAEGAEIDTSDPTLAEIAIVPKKLAGLTIVSREMANDSNPGALELVGAGLSRDLVAKVDASFFGSNTGQANQPAGLENLTGFSAVEVTGEIQNTDPFAEAIAAAEVVGAQINHFVAHPDDVLALAKIKTGTGSNQPLLGTDATVPGKRVVLGIPVLACAAVTPGTIWGIPTTGVHVVVRETPELAVDGSSHFTSDRLAIRAILRIGFAFVHPAAIVKITTTEE